MLSSVTINCQVTKIVINPGSQLSVLQSVSQMSQVPMIAPLENVRSSMLIKCLNCQWFVGVSFVCVTSWLCWVNWGDSFLLR